MDELVKVIGTPIVAGLVNWTAKWTYSKVSGKDKTFLWQDKNAPLEKLNSKIGFDELKKKTRIVVIDDEDIFPLQLFVDSGYFIEKWNTVKDYSKLETGVYDIIVLDIVGVAKHISQDDGLGVLESLKKSNPSQIIVAYSGHSFDLSKQRFWDLADEKLAKPSDFLKTKDIIDNIIKNKFTPDRYINNLTALLQKQNLSTKEIKKIEGNIANVIKGKEKADWNTVLKSIESNKDLFSKVLNLSNTILKFFDHH